MNQREEQLRVLIAAQAVEWFIAQRESPLSQTQREAFIDWLRASPVHAGEYLAVGGLVEELTRAAKHCVTPPDALVMGARAAIHDDTVRPLSADADLRSLRRDADAHAPARHRPRLWAMLGGLAVAAAMTIVLSLLHLHDRTVYKTVHAEQRSWRMPDGSTVHLNSDSEIRVKFTTGRREVELIRGQASFQVERNLQRPFWVAAGEALVKAVGTEFDVYRHGPRTLVSVVEGRVAVWRASENFSSHQMDLALMQPTMAQYPAPVAHLDAGEQAQITQAAAVVSKRPDDVRKTVAWLQRQVVFDHDPLSAAVQEFNRYGALRIRIIDPALQAMQVSGIFSVYDVDSFIRFLQRQPEMRVERVGQEIIVAAAAPLP